MRSHLAPLTLAALIAASAAAPEAHADPRAPEVLKALEALREKRFEDALKVCAPGPQREIQPECPLLRAHALHALGRHLDAYEALQSFGAEGSPEAQNAPLARETFRSALLAHLARVSVVCNVEGPAEVLVNGKLAKTCPTKAAVVTAPGEIVIEVRKPGFKTAQTRIHASAGGTATARLELAPGSESSPQPAIPPSENNAEQSTETPAPSPETPAPPDAEASDPNEPATTSTEKKSKRIDPASYGPWKEPEPARSSSSSYSGGGGSSCSSDCKWVLITLGGLIVLGALAGIAAVVSQPDPLPADKGTIPPGQVEVPPLVAW